MLCSCRQRGFYDKTLPANGHRIVRMCICLCLKGLMSKDCKHIALLLLLRFWCLLDSYRQSFAVLWKSKWRNESKRSCKIHVFFIRTKTSLKTCVFHMHMETNHAPYIFICIWKTMCCTWSTMFCKKASSALKMIRTFKINKTC